ncbi:hypothetical protein PHO31112_01638 [Pandoraea horticolens]|uniref:Uncharacterized protein n=1 Tax=Pandoraea horticolens TaxID=2508298 RepID=A0A5E4TU20_9BURK|nr:hypothetical protein [Pandoraea horticolens]VVD91360.1 hypothetical protein PHO31112_01638 [Pandoraea horticolens]
MTSDEPDPVHADIMKIRAVTMRLVDEQARLLDARESENAYSRWDAIGDWRMLVVGVGLFAAGGAIGLMFLKAMHWS